MVARALRARLNTWTSFPPSSTFSACPLRWDWMDRPSSLPAQSSGAKRTHFSTSEDGTNFTTAWESSTVDNAGMQIRQSTTARGRGRYLRLTGKGGDGMFSVGELAVFEHASDLKAYVPAYSRNPTAPPAQPFDDVPRPIYRGQAPTEGNESPRYLPQYPQGLPAKPDGAPPMARLGTPQFDVPSRR